MSGEIKLNPKIDLSGRIKGPEALDLVYLINESFGKFVDLSRIPPQNRDSVKKLIENAENIYDKLAKLVGDMGDEKVAAFIKDFDKLIKYYNLETEANEKNLSKRIRAGDDEEPLTEDQIDEMENDQKMLSDRINQTLIKIVTKYPEIIEKL